MNKDRIKIILAIALLIICIIVFITSVNRICNKIDNKGLKNIVNEIWEGKENK